MSSLEFQLAFLAISTVIVLIIAILKFIDLYEKMKIDTLQINALLVCNDIQNKSNLIIAEALTDIKIRLTNLEKQRDGK
jgi:hypothetical protein